MNVVVYYGIFSCLLVTTIASMAVPKINRGRKNQYLLHEAIRQNDEQRLRDLLAPARRGQVNWQALINKSRRSDMPVYTLADEMPNLFLPPLEAPLHRAVRAENPVMVKILLEHGADVDVLNDLDQTPLNYLTTQNKYYFVESPGGLVKMLYTRNLYTSALLLLKHGANPNTKDCLLKAPLHRLCVEDSPKWELIEHLIKAGASPDQRDYARKSPADYVMEHQCVPNQNKFKNIQQRSMCKLGLKLVKGLQRKHGQPLYLPDLVIDQIVDYACPLVD